MASSVIAPASSGKTFTSIVAQGIYGGNKIVKYLNFFAYSVGFRTVKGCCVRGLEPMTEKQTLKNDRDLAKLSRRFYQRMTKPAYPPPTLLELMIFRMARTSIKQMLGDDNRDHTYFRDKGWFESDFYYPTRLGTGKKALGAIFDWGSSRIYKRREPVPRPATSAGGSDQTAGDRDE